MNPIPLPMKHQAWLLLLAFLAFVPARATSYTYSAMVDLSSPTATATNIDDFALPSALATFPLAVGDTLSGTITFDQTMLFTGDGSVVQNPNQLTLNFAPTTASASDNSETVMVTLLGLGGSLAATDLNPNPGFDSGGGVSVSDLFNPGTNPNDVSFTGFSYTLRVTSEIDPGLTYAPSNIEVKYTPGFFKVVPTPEPGTWALMLAGLGGLVLSRRFFGLARS